MTGRQLAHQRLDDYIDAVAEAYRGGGDITDGWLLSIDQYAVAAALEETKE